MSRALLPAALAGTALGILAGDAGALTASWSLLTGGVGGGLAACGIALRRAAIVAAGVLVLAATVGAWRGAQTTLPTGPGSIGALIGTGEQGVQGTVVEDPRPRGERQQVVLGALVVQAVDGGASPAAGRLLVRMPRSVAVEAGDQLRFTGRIEAAEDFDGFAYREYLARQGIGAISSAFRAEVSPGSRGPLVDALSGWRATLLDGLSAMVPEPEAALGAGILLGVRTSIAPEVSDAFSTAGLTHVVAISGWNIAIVAALAAAGTRPLLRAAGGRLIAVAVAGAAVGGYVLLTGASPSVVRAALMAAALVVARLGGSPAHAMSALMVAALAMLLAAPPVLWDVGFQLSALATAGLVWFAGPIEARMRRWPGLIREPVALTLAAQLTTLPVILLNFERLSLVSPAANVLVVPLVPMVMLCSAAAALVGALDGAVHVSVVSDVLCWVGGGAAWLYLRLMILCGQAAAAVPFASVSLAAPAWLAAGWYPMLVVLHRRMARGRNETASEALDLALPGLRRLARPVPLVAGTLLVLGLFTIGSQPDGRLHLAMLDVGQGDAILVRGPTGRTLLVDGGPDPDLAARRIGETLPFWQRSLDAVLLTHPHEDHVAGLVPAVERYRVALILEPGREYQNASYARFRRLASAERGATVALARTGMRLQLEPGVDVSVLFPSARDAETALPEGDINNASVVILVETDTGFRALLTGDAEAPVERALLERGLVPDVDLLKIGHHGSESSTTPAFLAQARPEVALISTGTGNEYGHPHDVTLAHLAQVPSLVVHRTDLEGTVDVVVEAGRPQVSQRGTPDPGSIAEWSSRVVSAPRRCSKQPTSRTASSPTRAASPAWRRRRRGSSRGPASRWTSHWSRPPPCSMTSTSSTRATLRSPTGSLQHHG